MTVSFDVEQRTHSECRQRCRRRCRQRQHHILVPMSGVSPATAIRNLEATASGVADVAEGERPQERPQRRGRVGPGEDQLIPP